MLIVIYFICLDTYYIYLNFTELTHNLNISAVHKGLFRIYRMLSPVIYRRPTARMIYTSMGIHSSSFILWIFYSVPIRNS